MERASNKLIVSVHIPKTGGTSLLQAIREGSFGNFLLDYDRPAVRAGQLKQLAHRLKSYFTVRLKRAELLRDYGIIHGHFLVGKYAFLHPQAEFITFMREPVARVISGYYYLKYTASKNPVSVSRNPDIPLITQGKLGLLEFASRRHMLDVYERFTRGLALDDFALIGITERYPESVRLLNERFGTHMAAKHERKGDHAQYEDEYRHLLPQLVAMNRRNTLVYERALRLFDKKVAS